MDYSKKIAELEKEIAELRAAEQEAATKRQKERDAQDLIENGVETLLDGLSFYYDKETLDRVFNKILSPDIVVDQLKTLALASEVADKASAQTIGDMFNTVFRELGFPTKVTVKNINKNDELKSIIEDFIN